MKALDKLKAWAKQRDTPLKRILYRTAKTILRPDFPPLPVIHLTLYAIIKSTMSAVFWLINVLYWKPTFICWLSNRPRRLYLYGRGLPYVTGPLDISVGDDCRISTQITVSGRTSAPEPAQLIIGNNVDIGWGSGVYVGTRIIIGNNVRIAGQGTLAGYPGHPINAVDRAMGKPELDHQARDIVLEDDVWLARGVIVNAGVTIGEGSIIAAGSVVTKDIPAGVLAGGIPAKTIRNISDDKSTSSVSKAA
jgi:serine acetyltransferase